MENKNVGILELKNFRLEVMYIYIHKIFNIDQYY
jgi:hypothetical protein